MTKIDDAIYEVSIRDGITNPERIALINELRKALPSDRWTFRWSIWALAAVAALPVLVISVRYGYDGKIDPNAIPQAVVSLASTALGALAAFITPAARRADASDEGAVAKGGPASTS